MMRSLLLGLRLAVGGGREAMVRLVFTCVGVAVGITLLLLAFTGAPAAADRIVRALWQHAESAVRTTDFDRTDDPPVEAPDGALFLVVSDSYDGRPIVRAYVAALGERPPVMRGLERLPGPGEVALSPALRALLASTSDSYLADRFPGRDALTIGPAGLAHDGELVAIIGRTTEQMRAVASAREVHGFYRDGLPNGELGFSLQAGAIATGSVVVLAPVAVLIVVVARVAWRQRERRLAAIRLVGATRSQIALVAAAETGLAAVIGTGLGWALYEVGRRVIAATVIFQGGHFWLEDLAAPPRLLAAVLVGTPLLVTLTTIVSLRQIQRSALAVHRRGRRRGPSPWTSVPLVVGLGGMLALLAFRDPLTQSGDNGSSLMSVLSSLLTLSTIEGFVLMGPWLVMQVGRGIARLTRSVPGLLAARRIAADPYATFRSVSAVVLAATAVTFSGSVAGTGPAVDDPSRSRPRTGVLEVHVGVVPEEQVRPLLTEDVVALRNYGSVNVVRCMDLARVLTRVSCPFPPGSAFDTGLREPDPERDAAARSTISTLYIPTDGSVAAESRVRTAVALLVPNALVNSDRAPVQNDFSAYFSDLDRLFRVAAVFVLIVGAFGLTATMIGGLIERRRPFALLRASGVRLGELRRTVFLEAAATMTIASVAGAAVGLLLAYAVGQQTVVDWRWPGLEVYVSVAVGVVAALLFSTLALPLLGLTTRHDAVRYE